MVKACTRSKITKNILGIGPTGYKRVMGNIFSVTKTRIAVGFRMGV